jgi:hypothetical protein
LCGKAAETLGKNLDAANPAAANRAAELILAQALKGIETLDLAAEVQALRQEIEEGKRRGEHPATEG